MCSCLDITVLIIITELSILFLKIKKSIVLLLTLIETSICKQCVNIQLNYFITFNLGNKETLDHTWRVSTLNCQRIQSCVLIK